MTSGPTRGFGDIRDAWLARAAGLGTRIRARLQNEETSGMFEGIDEAGALLLREAQGRSRTHRGRRRILLGHAMLLAIDAGNTNIVFAVHDGEELRAEWRAVTETTRTADEYAVCSCQLLALEGLRFADLDAAIIATVVPAALFDLRAALPALSQMRAAGRRRSRRRSGHRGAMSTGPKLWAPTGWSTRWRPMSATRAR